MPPFFDSLLDLGHQLLHVAAVAKDPCGVQRPLQYSVVSTELDGEFIGKAHKGDWVVLLYNDGNT